MANDDAKLDLTPFWRMPDLNDGPLAEHVADELDGSYAWVAGLGWLCNNGKVWNDASEPAVVEDVRLVLRQMIADAIAAGATSVQINAMSRLLGAGKIRAVAGLVKGILELPLDAFDTALDHLNTPSGVVNLRTGKLLPHSDKFRFTKITGAAYDPDAVSDDWNAALLALPEDVVRYFQLRLGQALTGHTPPDDKLIIAQGAGENGKSVQFDAIRAAVGGFAGLIPERVLMANPGDHPTEMTMLRGLRLAVLEELPEGARFNIKRLKDTVGTSTMTARKIAKDNITWESTHSLFVTTNYRPRINETDNGTWRRLELIRFPYTFRRPGLRLRAATDRRGDPHLRERLRREPQPAVLAWLVAGAVAWYKRDRTMPPPPNRVARDTLTWRKETDHILGFLSEELVFAPNRFVLASDLYTRFSSWLEAGGHKEWSSQTFGSRFSEHTDVTANAVRKTRKRIGSVDLSRPGSGTTAGPRVVAAPLADGSYVHLYQGLAWRDNSPEPEDPDA